MTSPAAWRHQGEPDKAPLHYTECGLDDVYLLSGYESVTTPYGDGITVKDLDQLHQAIGCDLALNRKVLAGKELRFLRKQMDLTQSVLGKLIGLSSQQVARWEKGESQISGPADLLVRALYIQHAKEKLDLKELAESLEEHDAPMTTGRICLERTGRHGWKVKRAA